MPHPTITERGITRYTIIMDTPTEDAGRCRRITCDCGAYLWDEIVEADGSAYLVMDGKIVTYITCGCAECGKEWHWSPQEVRLRRILAMHRR
jgi:hypothetical protein